MEKATTYKKTINATTENLADVRKFVSQYVKEQGFSSDKVADITLAVDEACTNIIKHAYGYDSSKKLQIHLEFDNEEVAIYIEDYGKSFDPERYKKPSLHEQVKQKKRGGMGIHLMKSLMDKIHYEKKGQKNVLCLCKKRD